ncbi:Rhomboid family protease [Salisediminibacterium beveridgei]|uniref:Rhomboid family protease n=2 Tax=Salisediminibacterium beveridgei TaxID=632773 RepID=A0A1D7QUD4_9BACI|nr:Rhomboid family protease [Salisediminibacterium beveridgei]
MQEMTGVTVLNEMTERVRFWEVLYHLIIQEKMRLIHMNETEETAWIEDDRREYSQIIRISRKNFDWSNQLRGDIQRTQKTAEDLRKKLNLRQANVINLILSQFTPIDDYEELLSGALPFTAGGKGQFRTILLTMDQLEERFFPLATEWELTETPSFIPVPQLEVQGNETEIIQTMKHMIKKASRDRQNQEQSLFLQGKLRLTTLLIGVVVPIFLWMEYVGSTTSTLTLVQFGAKYDPLILEGEWWRFFSAMFIHIGPFHLLMNSLALLFLGGAVERIFGSKRFLVIYFVAGLFGSVASFVFNDNISAGASGAIFGCFGALLYFGAKHKRLFFRTMGMNVIVILAINLAFGFLVPMVDNGAHIGGLIGGFLASAITGLPNHSRDKSMLTALLATLLLLSALLFAGFRQDVEPMMMSSIQFQMAGEWVDQNEYELAKPYLKEIIDYKEEDVREEVYVNSHFLLSYVFLQTDELEEAEEKLRKTIELDDQFHEAYYNLALVMMEKEQYEDAYEYAQEAAFIRPETEDYQSLLREIEELL